MNILNSFSQVVLDSMLAMNQEVLVSKFTYKALARMRQLLLKFGDSPVRYVLEGKEILLPFSHDLPYYKKAFPQYSSNVGVIAQLVQKKYKGSAIIDVGANIGDTVTILRHYTDAPILCVEGNPQFFSLLKKNISLFSGVFSEYVFVGFSTGQINAVVESSVGGTASLKLVEGANKIETKTLTDILQSWPQLPRPKFLKIDTDGFDCCILRAELEWLKATKPVIFFEYDPELLRPIDPEGLEIFNHLYGIGYKTAVIYANTGEYLGSADLSNADLINEIRNHGQANRPGFYCDICVFHEEDLDLF